MSESATAPTQLPVKSEPAQLAVPESYAALYRQLAEPFDLEFKDTRGGVELTYISGEQVIRRLNEVLGVAGWSFEIVARDINAEADECWVQGRLTASIIDRTIIREQFGSQKIRRSRSTGAPLDIGFDWKGASTDALKKCASLLGVGLYLSRKEAPPAQRQQQAQRRPQQQQRTQQPPRQQAQPRRYVCSLPECKAELVAQVLDENTTWDPERIASEGNRHFQRVLCFTHLKAATEAKRAEQQPTPSAS